MGNWDSMGRFGKGVGKGGKGEEWRSEGRGRQGEGG